MRFRAVVAAVCVGAVVPIVAADELWIGFTDEAAETRVELLRGGVETVEFEIEVPGVSLRSVDTEAGRFTELTIPGLGRVGDVGSPMLPALRRFVEIPATATAAVSVHVIDRRTIDLAEAGMPSRLYPVQLPRPKCDCKEARNWRFSYDDSAYRANVGELAAVIDGPFALRDHRMLMVTTVPAAYDADRGRIEVAVRLRVTIELEGGDVATTTARKDRLSSPHYDAFLDSAALNINLGGALRDAGWAYPDDAPVEFLIVTPPQFVADLQPFVDWKASCGFDVTVATTDVIGSTTSAIKSYITGLYDGDAPPVYILMIGDSPSPLVTYTVSSGGSGGTDLPFVQMDPDLYPDMMIARWPIDNAAQLVAMRDKILHYEQPTAANSTWLNRALFLGGDDYASHSMTTHQDVIAVLMEPPPNSAECDYWDGEAIDYTTQQFIDEVDTGRGWAVYSAHCSSSGMAGDPEFYTDDVDDLANTGMYSILVGHCCSSNVWNSVPNAFGEETVTLADKGFVSYWGGSNSTYWDEDDWLQRGFFDAMFDEDLPGNSIAYTRQYSNVAAAYAGLTEVTLKGGDEHYYWHCYNLNGDPSLDPFTRAPIALNVGAPAVVPPVANDDFQVVVTDPVLGAVPVAMVGVSQGGTLLGAGLTDDTGTAEFHIDAPSAGEDLMVRVTAHNHLPTDAAVIVAAGSDGVVTLDSPLYRCDSTVTVDVFDEDLAGHEAFAVDLSATPSGGSTTVIIDDVGGSVVRFQGTALLGSDLVVADGDTLTVTYHDEDTGSGAGADKTDSAALDCAGPVIEDVQVVATHETVSVSFTTSEPGSTIVRYGASVPPAETATEPGLRTEHELVLEGFDPCASYWISVASADALGNLAEDTNGGLYYAVETMGWQVLLDEALDGDPGWEISNGSHPVDGWAFGEPTGQGQDSHGGPDPTSGFTGPHVYGVNLNGDAPAPVNTENELQLTTPSIDLSNVTSAQLRFRRWLGVEKDTYDHARILVSTDGGTSWNEVWENGGSDIDDQAWVEHIVDLSTTVGEPDVRIQWTYGSADSIWDWCGWNIDDVVVEGSAPCIIEDAIFADGFETGNCSRWSREIPGS